MRQLLENTETKSLSNQTDLLLKNFNRRVFLGYWKKSNYLTNEIVIFILFIKNIIFLIRLGVFLRKPKEWSLLL